MLLCFKHLQVVNSIEYDQTEKYDDVKKITNYR